MPTSSQAMILQQEGGSSTKIILNRGKASTESIACPVVNFDIHGKFRTEKFEGHKVHARQSQCNRDGSFSSPLLCCRGLLLYDSEAGVYFWKDIPENAGARPLSQQIHAPDHDDDHKDEGKDDEDPDNHHIIGQSESGRRQPDGKSGVTPSECSMYGLNEESYGRLISLGFRKPSDFEQDQAKPQHNSITKCPQDNVTSNTDKFLRYNATRNTTRQSRMKKTVSFGTSVIGKESLETECWAKQEEDFNKEQDR